MANRKLERVIQSRRLTPDEAARDADIRRKVEEEFPPAAPVPTAGSGSLSEALKEGIRDSGKSVYQIAKEAHVAQIVISRFLSGQRDIRMATADKLADAIGLRVKAGS